jgi:hypothetical protein
VFGINRSLPTNWSDINAIKSIDATRFAEGPSPKGFSPIDEQSEALQAVYDDLGNLGGYNDVITEHKYSTGLMKPMALQCSNTYAPED